MFQPLQGYKIMDCSRLLPFQYCTLLLADLGAEVLKIEEPKKGDYGRWANLNASGKERTSFVMANRNKKSIVLNLKKSGGKEIFKKLAAKYDVLLETFRPGVMDRLGLGYQVINKINPYLIYCSVTGYGQTGPYRLKAGHDINYISLAGILGKTGMHTGRPVIPGIPFADMAGGGVFPAFTIIASLLGREKTGKGQHIDVAMTDVMTSFNIVNIASFLQKKSEKTTPSYDLHGRSLCYNTFKTRDSRFISIGNLEKKFWKNFCEAIGRKDLIEKHYSLYEEGEETTETLKEIFASKTRSEWVEIMKDIDNCFAPINTSEEVLEDPHMTKRGMFGRLHDPKRGDTVQIGFPARFSDSLDCNRTPAPQLGEHTIETLEDLGLSQNKIERLKQEKVI